MLFKGFRNLSVFILFLIGFSGSIFSAQEIPENISYSLQVPLDYSDLSAGYFSLQLELHKSTAPKAPTMILLPGGPGITADYLMLSSLSKKLKSQFHLLFIHPRGSNKSPLPPQSVLNSQVNNIFNQLRDIQHVQEQMLENQSVYILGHSFGCTLATLYSGFQPKSILGTICVSGSPNMRNWERYLESYFEGDFTYFKRHLSLRKPEEKLEKNLLSRWGELQKWVSSGQAILPMSSGDWALNEVELRSLFRPILQRKSEFVLSTVEGLLNRDANILASIQADWDWAKENDNLVMRQYLYCNELLSERALERKIFSTPNSWGDYYGCSDFERKKPLNSVDDLSLLKRVDSLVLVFWGKFDFIVPYDEIKESYNLIKRKKIIPLNQSSHYGYNTESELIWQEIQRNFL